MRSTLIASFVALSALVSLGGCTAGAPLETSSDTQDPLVAWRPTPGTSWQWQLTGRIDVNVDASLFDVDLFETPESTIAELHGRGRRVVCYFSAGSWEPGRPDSDRFPSAARGRTLDGWPDERWLDHRRGEVRTLMQGRLDMAVAKHCDGVEPDNVDGYANESGFPLRGTDQIAFNRFLAREAHTRGLAIALKNDIEQVKELVDDFDFALNEECHEYEECDELLPFIRQNKAVLHVEYGGSSLASSVCPAANRRNFDTLIKRLDLDAWRVACR